MKKEASGRVFKIYYDYVLAHKGEAAAKKVFENLTSFEGEPYNVTDLLDEYRWFSARIMAEVMRRVAELFHDDTITAKVQLEAAQKKRFGLMDILMRFFYPSPRVLFSKLPGLIERDFNKVSIVKVEDLQENSAVIKVRFADPYSPPSRYFCYSVKGALASMPLSTGHGMGQVEETECSVPLDQKGVIDGRFYRVNDRQEVFEFQESEDEKTTAGRLVGRLTANGTFRLGGTLYGAPTCVYHVRWPKQGLWARTFGAYFSRDELLRDAIRELEERKSLVEQKYLEIERLNAGLEAKVKERTADLLNSNRLKDLFISIMDHDIKNDLTVILGYAALLKRHTTGEAQNYSQIIENNAEKVNELISAARLFSKLQTVDLKHNLVKTDLAAVLSAISPALRSKADQKKIGLAINLPAGEYYFNAIPLAAEIFMNLIDNAVKYSRPGGQVEVYAENRGDKFNLCVKDFGRGISDDYKRIIFNRFERLEVADKAGVEGSGLGLAIVKALVALHGGSVWVEDNPAGGSIFKVELTRSK